MIKGTDKAGNAGSEIVSLATDSSKIPSVRTVSSDGTQVYTPIGGTLAANTTYDFEIVVDLNNQTAEVTSGTNTVTVDINIIVIYKKISFAKAYCWGKGYFYVVHRIFNFHYF